MSEHKQKPQIDWSDRLRDLLNRLGEILNPPTPAPQPVPVHKRPPR